MNYLKLLFSEIWNVLFIYFLSVYPNIPKGYAQVDIDIVKPRMFVIHIEVSLTCVMSTKIHFVFLQQ